MNAVQGLGILGNHAAAAEASPRDATGTSGAPTAGGARPAGSLPGDGAVLLSAVAVLGAASAHRQAAPPRGHRGHPDRIRGALRPPPHLPPGRTTQAAPADPTAPHRASTSTSSASPDATVLKTKVGSG